MYEDKYGNIYPSIDNMPKKKHDEKKMHIFFAIHSLLLLLVGAILIFALIRI